LLNKINQGGRHAEELKKNGSLPPRGKILFEFSEKKGMTFPVVANERGTVTVEVVTKGGEVSSTRNSLCN